MDFARNVSFYNLLQKIKRKGQNAIKIEIYIYGPDSLFIIFIIYIFLGPVLSNISSRVGSAK